MLQVIGPAQEVEDLINDPNFNINDWFGYIYLTCHFESKRQYIGKKNFFHTKNVKLGKKELAKAMSGEPILSMILQSGRGIFLTLVFLIEKGILPS